MTRKTWLAALLLAAAAAGGWYGIRGRAAPEVKNAPQQRSVAVKTQKLQTRVLPDTIPVFGEIQPGKNESISMPRPGQVSRLEVTVGQYVRQGTRLAVFATDPSGQTAFAQATSAVGFAHAELDRIRQLFSLQLATQSQLDAARKALQDARSALAAQNKTGAGQAVETLTAPFSGVVTAIPVAQGDRLQAGATILQLGHLDALRVYLGIEPAQRARVRPGMPVTLAPAQHPEQPIAATIRAVDAAVDPKTQLVNILVLLPSNAAASLLAGMRVQGAIEVGMHDGWGVPRQAVLSDEQGSYVFQAAADRARRINVTETAASGGIVGVEGKLDPALPVVVLGNYELQDGMAIREAAR